jgi:type 1 glutamine amidotransferase
VHPERHEIVAGLADFDVTDERYTDLRVRPEVVALATHEHDGREHPLVWAWMYGRSKVIYNALGHDAASYESEPTGGWLPGRCAGWSAEGGDGRRFGCGTAFCSGTGRST